MKQMINTMTEEVTQLKEELSEVKTKNAEQKTSMQTMTNKIKKLRCIKCKHIPPVPNPCQKCTGQDDSQFNMCKYFADLQRCNYKCRACTEVAHFKRYQDGRHGPIMAECIKCGGKQDGALACLNCGTRINSNSKKDQEEEEKAQ